MRLDLTEDEIDLMMRLCGGCDDSDTTPRDIEATRTKRLAMRLERYFRRKLRQIKRDRERDRPVG
jgi:hypothetical protein